MSRGKYGVKIYNNDREALFDAVSQSRQVGTSLGASVGVGSPMMVQGTDQEGVLPSVADTAAEVQGRFSGH